MRVLVCGGRDFADRALMMRTLFSIHETNGIHVIIEGGADGADRMAFGIAGEVGWGTETYDADWDTHGRAAGPMRNQKMLDSGKPDLVVAFPGGRGTADMVRRAKAKGVPVVEVSAESEEGRRALATITKDMPRREATPGERAIFDEHRRKVAAGEVKWETTEERAARRAAPPNRKPAT